MQNKGDDEDVLLAPWNHKTKGHSGLANIDSAGIAGAKRSGLEGNSLFVAGRHD